MKKETMLVVEDEDIMREALVDYFSGEGHAVDTAQDGDNALEKFNLKNYDIMIIDLRLPGRDGLSVLEEVRAKNPKAKVIMITAYPSLETETKAKQNGAIEYLTKPFELSYLETLINQSLEVDVVPTPVEEPVEEIVEEEIINPCIWTQAGIIKERMCDRRYECIRCDFHTAMMKNEKYKNDPRIEPYIEKVHMLLGKNLCRYTMSGDISFRTCSRLFNCGSCELDHMIQHEIERKLRVREENKKKRRAQKEGADLTLKKRPVRTDH
jgi:CheY-like chemotaxis protein